MNPKYVEKSKYSYDVWSPHFWFLWNILALSFTPSNNECMKRFTEYGLKQHEMVANLIPSIQCREIYLTYAREHPITAETFKDPKGFFKYIYTLNKFLHKQMCLIKGEKVVDEEEGEEDYLIRLKYWENYKEFKLNPQYIPQLKKGLVIDILNTHTASCKSFLIDQKYNEDDIIVISEKTACKNNILSSISNLVIDSWNNNLDEITIIITNISDVKIPWVKGIKGIFPYDIDENKRNVMCDHGIVLGHSILTLLSKVNPNTRVITIFDVCNAGNILNLPFECQIFDNKVKLEPFVRKRNQINPKLLCISSTNSHEVTSENSLPIILEICLKHKYDIKNILKSMKTDLTNQTPVLSFANLSISEI